MVGSDRSIVLSGVVASAAAVVVLSTAVEVVEVSSAGENRGTDGSLVIGAGFRKRRFLNVARPDPKTFTQYCRLGKHSTMTPDLFHRARLHLLL